MFARSDHADMAISQSLTERVHSTGHFQLFGQKLFQYPRKYTDDKYQNTLAPQKQNTSVEFEDF